jgi:branched-chain amino acid transport system permease protein
LALDQLAQYLVSGITLGAIYALVALGFTIIFNVTGIVNFAQGEFVMLGGMVSYWFLTTMQLPMVLAFALTVIIVAVLGLGLERLAIRPARNAPVLNLIIITIGASILLRGVAGELWGRDALAMPPISGSDPVAVAGVAVAPQSLWVIGTALVVMVGLHLLLTHTMIGKALRACAINRRASSLVGIDARLMSGISFTLAAGLGAIGGIMIAPITMAQYDVGMMLGLKGFAAAALGGFGSQIGAMAGGIILGVLEALGAGYISSAYKDAIALVVLFAILFIRSGALSRERADA